MGDIARECTRVGDQIMIKVGVEGRVLLGPVGQPGNFNVPIRIAVRRDTDQKAAAGKLYQVPTSVAFGQTQGEFTLVSEPMAVPFLQAHADEDYTILVGFDEDGAASGRQGAARRKSARAHRADEPVDDRPEGTLLRPIGCRAGIANGEGTWIAIV